MVAIEAGWIASERDGDWVGICFKAKRTSPITDRGRKSDDADVPLRLLVGNESVPILVDRIGRSWRKWHERCLGEAG